LQYKNSEGPAFLDRRKETHRIWDSDKKT